MSFALACPVWSYAQSTLPRDGSAPMAALFKTPPLLLAQPRVPAAYGFHTTSLRIGPTANRSLFQVTGSNSFVDAATCCQKSVSTMWPAFVLVANDPNAWKNLEYVGRHLPIVGPVILEGVQQSKQHPRITTILKSVRPDI